MFFLCIAELVLFNFAKAGQSNPFEADNVIETHERLRDGARQI
jgi:hypothetical protein